MIVDAKNRIRFLQNLPWVRHGFLNTFEHIFTRFADAFISLLLLWGLSPESFSRLAIAQAWVAPMLLFFVAPETVLYRDFSKLKALGVDEFSARLRAFRLFSWGKLQFSLVLCIIGAFLLKGPNGFFQTFCVFVWAFSLSLAPQLSGPDKEFLRLDLKLHSLNIVSLYQKISLLIGIIITVFLFPTRFEFLALSGVFSLLSTAWIAYFYAKKALLEMGLESQVASYSKESRVVEILSETLTSFSIWNHLYGVVLNWVQTLDIFVLGVLQFPARQIGFYAAVIKFSNFLLAIPMALTNLFGVWIGRQSVDNANLNTERKNLTKFSFILFLFSLIQAIVFILISPIVINWLSHNRWSIVEQQQMQVWLRWVIGGVVFLGSSFLFSQWLILRTNVRSVVMRVALPWLTCSMVLYFAAAFFGDISWVAIANVGVGFLFFVFVKGSMLNELASVVKH